MNKKLVTTILATALIGAIGIGSTLAFLSDTTQNVTNTFTVGNVRFDKEFNNGITESEVKRNDTTGEYNVDVDGANKWTKTRMDYTSLIPGETVMKDPTIHIAANSEDAWVLVKVTNTDKPEYASVNWNSEEWENITDAYKIAKDITGDIDYVVYLHKAIIKKSNTVTDSTIFSSVTMANDIEKYITTNEDGSTNAKLPDDILVSAFAIQATGFTTGNGTFDLAKAKDEIKFAD